MSANTVISTVDNITLVTLVGFPAQVDSIATILKSIADYDINIDMISMAPTHGAFPSPFRTTTWWMCWPLPQS
jgi:aspartokinase